MTTSAAAVSRALRGAGFLPVAPADRNREGLRVTTSGDRVRVVADLDAPGAAVRMAADARDALAARYAVTDLDGAVFYVAAR